MDEDLSINQYYYEHDIIRKESCHIDFEKIKLEYELLDETSALVRHRIMDCEMKLNELNQYEDIREAGMNVIEGCKIGVYQNDEIIQGEIKRIHEAHRRLIRIRMRKPIINIPKPPDVEGLFAYYTRRIKQVQLEGAIGDIVLLQTRWNELKPQPLERWMKKIKYNQFMIEHTNQEIEKEEYLNFRELYRHRHDGDDGWIPCREPIGYLKERKRKFYDNIQLIVYHLLPNELPTPLVMNMDPEDEIIQNKKRIDELWILEKTCTDPDKDPCILINALKHRNKMLLAGQPQPFTPMPNEDRDQYVRDKLLQIFFIQRDKTGNPNRNHQRIQLLRYDIHMANKNDNITMDLSCVDEDDNDGRSLVDKIKYYEDEIQFLTRLITKKNEKNGIIHSSIRPYQRKIKAFKYSISCYKQQLKDCSITTVDGEPWEMPLSYEELVPGGQGVIPVIKYHGFFSDATKFRFQLKKAKDEGDMTLYIRLSDLKIGFNLQLKDWHVTLILLNSYQFILQHPSYGKQVIKSNMIKATLQTLK